MTGTISNAEIAATNITLENGSGPLATLTSESDPDAWFFDAAQVLLGKDAGLHLHYLTGYPQSTCYAYVAKDPRKRRPPPEHLLRVLCHSDQGEPWHDAFMHECKARWWIARQSERKLAALAQNIFKQLGEVIEQ